MTQLITSMRLALLLLIAFGLSAAPEATDQWVVRTSSGPPDSALLDAIGASHAKPLESLEGFYLIDCSQSRLEPAAIENRLESSEGILWIERQFRDQHVSPDQIPGNPFDEPRYKDAWHISNAGQSKGKRGEDLNLPAAWDWNIDGSGVMVAVVDSGMQLNHPDLIDNIRHDLSLDLIDGRNDSFELTEDEDHGTAVAGIIAARDNTIGSVGVAYGAHLVPVRYLGKSQTDSNTAEALGHKRNLIAVYNNSWGPSYGDQEDNLVAMISPSNLGRFSLVEGTRSGRNGLGNIFVFSAGNQNEDGANVNYNGWANMPETIAVASIGNGGKHVSYSEEGAALLVSAPSGGQSLGITTTDRTGVHGYDPSDYTSGFSGTSAAAPMVSGVIALMLDANPLLGWRDVQHILVRSAIQVDADNEEWQVNGAGHPVSHFYGFGRVDASSAIQTALSWEPKSEARTYRTTRSVFRSLPDNDGNMLESELEVTRQLRLEHVELELTSNHRDWGDLYVELVSPSGTRSVLAKPHTDARKSYARWTYTSNFHWDERSEGTWTLRVADLGDGGSGHLSEWTLILHGTDIDNGENRIPVAMADEHIGTEYPVTLPVLANDEDPDGDSLDVISLYQPEFGDLTINMNNEIVYQPGQDFEGIDQFGYSVSDSRGGTADALVSITHPGPVARMDQVVTTRNRPVSIPVLANDFDRSGDPLELTEAGTAQNGITTMESDTVLYEPQENFIGLDTFVYTVSDNRHGETNGNVRAFVSANEDYALLFDGVDDHVRIEADDALDITQAITMESHFYLRSYGEFGNVGFGRILDRDTYSMLVNGTDHSLYPDHSLVVAFEVRDGDGTKTITANSVGDTISLNRWHTVAVTYDSEKVRMFVDGREVEVQNVFGDLGGSIIAKQADLLLGESENGERAFDGLIDWVRIWNRIRPDHSLRSGDRWIAESDRIGLIGWWQFLEGVGPTAYDSVGNDNHGTVVEARWSPIDPSLLSSVFE